jgi:hypothetical protein
MKKAIALSTSSMFIVLYSLLNMFDYDAMLKNFEVLNPSKATLSYTLVTYIGLYYVFILKTFFSLCVVFALLTIISVTSVAAFTIFVHDVIKKKKLKGEDIDNMEDKYADSIKSMIKNVLELTLLPALNIEYFFLIFLICVPLLLGIGIGVYKKSFINIDSILDHDKSNKNNIMKTNHHMFFIMFLFLFFTFLGVVVSKILLEKE